MKNKEEALHNRMFEKGKVALVTGGTRGIGKAIVQLLTQQGCRVIYTGTKRNSPSHPATQYWPLDLADDASIAEFLKRLKKVPQIDILVNNAGINIIEPIDALDADHWEKIIKVNLTGSMLLMKEAARIMKKNKRGGRILNISSIFGLVSKAKRNAYSASKAGLIGLTRASALDLAADRIMVNALCPGFVLTDMTKHILSPKEIRVLSAEIPLGRFGREMEIAKTALFLCSDWNTYITGQTVVVDGGFMIQ